MAPATLLGSQVEKHSPVKRAIAGSIPAPAAARGIRGEMHRENSKAVGERTEGMIIAALLQAGQVVLMPFGDNQRYDLVIDVNGRFIRIQCKTARYPNRGDSTVLSFETSSSQTHRGRGRQHYRGQIEYFGVYSPDCERCFLVPVDEVGRQNATLRLRGGQQPSKARYADTYDLKSSWWRES